jgi:hypothetical protein
VKNSSKNRRAKHARPAGKGPAQRKRRSSRSLQFSEVRGKTVEFVEMSTDADFPSVEIAFDDKTALHFLMEPRLSMEPTYSNWKTGNQRVLRRWTAVDCR